MVVLLAFTIVGMFLIVNIASTAVAAFVGVMILLLVVGVVVLVDLIVSMHSDVNYLINKSKSK